MGMTSEVQGVGGNTPPPGSQESDPRLRSAPCPLPELGSPHQEGKGQKPLGQEPHSLAVFWASGSSLGLSFLFDRVACRVAVY